MVHGRGLADEVYVCVYVCVWGKVEQCGDNKDAHICVRKKGAVVE